MLLNEYIDLLLIVNNTKIMNNIKEFKNGKEEKIKLISLFKDIDVLIPSIKNQKNIINKMNLLKSHKNNLKDYIKFIQDELKEIYECITNM